MPLAVQLGQSHPAVSQMSRRLLKHGVVREWPDPKDDRRRLLGLARRGRELFLETSSVLKPAISLYESVGFVHVPPPGARSYDRADVYMEYRGTGAGRQVSN